MTEGNQPLFSSDDDWKAQARAEKEKLAEQFDAPIIASDDDWKAQAKAEKEKLAQETATATESPTVPAEDAAPAVDNEFGQVQANFESLVSSIVTQAMIAMGGAPDPQTGRRVARLDAARLQIDLLEVLQEKTKGNLNEEEIQTIQTVLYELKNQYIRISQMAIRQMAGIDDRQEQGMM